MPIQWASNSVTDFTKLDFSAACQGSPTVTSTPFSNPFSPGADTKVTVTGLAQTGTLMGTGFTFDAGGALTGGTILALDAWETGTFNHDVSLGGFSLDATDFLAVVTTPTTTDDAVLVRHLFSGNDQWNGCTERDVIAMGGGKDYDQDGDFGTVNGGAGDDYLDGFDGGRLDGGLGNDVLVDVFTLGRLLGVDGSTLTDSDFALVSPISCRMRPTPSLPAGIA